MAEKKTTEIQNILIEMKKVMEDKNIKSLSLFDYSLNQEVDIKGELIEWWNCSYNERQNILTITISWDYETFETLIEDMRKDLEEIKKIADKKTFKEVYSEIENEMEELQREKEKIEKKWNNAYQKLLSFKDNND